MDYKDVDHTVICTQNAKAGSADLFAMMPWVARLPKAQKVHKCEAHSFSQGRQCKLYATLLHIDLDSSIHYFCSSHLYSDRVSRWHTIDPEDSPQNKRVEKFFDKHVEWSEKAKADIEEYNKQFCS